MMYPVSLSLVEKLQLAVNQSPEKKVSAASNPLIDPFEVFIGEYKVMTCSWKSFSKTQSEISERSKEDQIEGARRSSERVACAISRQRLFAEIEHSQNVTFLSCHHLATVV
jgi:hypothetical protein